MRTDLLRGEKRYLSRQHLIEQNAVGPPVHRFVVGLVGHNLRRRQRKRAVRNGESRRRGRPGSSEDVSGVF